MKKNLTLDQARFISSAGKLLHDFLFEVQADHVQICCKDSPFGETTMSQLHVINTVRAHGQLSMTELAGMLGITPPSATVMVDRLVEKGVFTRQHCTSDRRKVMVYVSPAAEIYIQKLEGAVVSGCKTLVEKIGPATARQWCEVLEKVKRILENDFNMSMKMVGETPVANDLKKRAAEG
ncbi:MAG: MarR family transcriptional regulator [Desulfobacteraceae bacterium]|nr:MarR family transcriptional regulator [Desulfobacteraceae bacterium]